jgi:alpha-L-fucosidase
MTDRLRLRRAVARGLAIASALAAGATALAVSDWPEAHPAPGRQPRRPAGYEPFHYPRSPEEIRQAETSALTTRAAAARRAREATIARGPYAATFESISTHRAPEWFQDAKLGLFLDWGPWSVGGWAPQAEKATYPDWYEKRLLDEYRDYHVKTWGADIGPDDLIELLRGDELKPARLAGLAKAAGMRYVVPFLKHHGGYCLWDSSFTHRDSMEWGLRRDVARELANAFRAAGLRYGAYVSLGEWNYPVVRDGGLRTVTLNGGDGGPLTPDTPFVSGKVPVADYVGDYLLPSLQELIDETHPDILWFDGDWEAPPEAWRGAEIAAYFYDVAAAAGREVAVNDRFGKDTRGHAGWGDFYTSEYHVITGLETHPWEENRSLSHSYGYNWEESLDDRYVLSEDDSLDLLLRVVANGGNLLLMVSPDGSGRVPGNQERRLRFLGSWLERHGEAVYGTRPVGLAEQPPWGYVTKSKAGDRLYCIVRRWPTDGRLRVPVPARATAASVIGSSARPTVESDAAGVRVDLGGIRPPDAHASVVVVTISEYHGRASGDRAGRAADSCVSARRSPSGTGRRSRRPVGPRRSPTRRATGRDACRRR